MKPSPKQLTQRQTMAAKHYATRDIWAAKQKQQRECVPVIAGGQAEINAYLKRTARRP